MRINTGGGLRKVVRDGRALMDMSEDVDTRLSEVQKAGARRIVAANAQGATLAEQVADAEALMIMLGVHPTQRDDIEQAFLPLPRCPTSVR